MLIKSRYKLFLIHKKDHEKDIKKKNVFLQYFTIDFLI